MFYIFSLFTAQKVGLDDYIAAFRQLRMTGGFTEDERLEINQCFDKFDADMSGEEQGCAQAGRRLR